LLDATRRAIKREVQDIAAIAKKTIKGEATNQFEQELKAYYKAHREAYKKIVAPTYWAYAEALNEAAAREVGLDAPTCLESCVEQHIDRTTEHHCNLSELRILKTLNPARAIAGKAISALDIELEMMLESYPGIISDWEATRMNGLVSKASWSYLDIPGMSWLTLDNNPLCEAMDGATVEIDSTDCGNNPFSYGFDTGSNSLVAHEIRSVEDFRPSWKLSTPPLYLKCNCTVCAKTK
jgi:hypothetical protein